MHSAVTASQCLQLPPFRYCACFLGFFLEPSSLFSGLSGRLGPSCRLLLSSFSIFSFPSCNRDNLINQTMCFFCSQLPARPPPSFHLSSPCIQCFPHTRSVVCATPTPSRTPTDYSAAHTTAVPLWVFFLFRSQYLAATRHTHTSSNFLKPNAELRRHISAFPPLSTLRALFFSSRSR